jgi:hypothetical protein
MRVLQGPVGVAVRAMGLAAGLAVELLAGTGLAVAQETRGNITGLVRDASGGVLPGATVTAVHGATGQSTAAATEVEGTYHLPFLTPGSYAITVELEGFKRATRKDVEVRIADRLTLDFVLEVGALEETVTVAAGTPLLESRSASVGQVIDERRIQLMPLADGNPFTLTRLAAGTVYSGNLAFARAFDNNQTSAITANGAVGGNEFTLDGAPNMSNNRRVAFVPPAGAVQEFKVETSPFDAAQGHTAGATINVGIKSGTNRYGGDLYYHHRDESLGRNNYFLERANRPKEQLDYKRFGFTAGGPVKLGFYDGTNKTFVFSAVEWLYDRFPEPGQYTVPSVRQRSGDFSELLGLGITIYDPATARLNAAGQVIRDPFPNNIIPADRIDPTARRILQYYPLPNQVGNAQGQNNFLSSAQQRSDDFYSMNFRVDHQFAQAHRSFVRYSRNSRVEDRNNWAGTIDGVTPTGNFLYRTNDALAGDHVWTIDTRTVLNVRGSWSRFEEPRLLQSQGNFDPASLGFSAATAALFGGAQYFPNIVPGAFSPIGEALQGVTGMETFAVQPNVSRYMGNHSLRAGYDYRRYREYAVPNYHAAGRYNFTSAFTNAGTGQATAPIGQDLAAFLLGLPADTSVLDVAADRDNRLQYHGLFFQDDWKISSKLTVNLGLRYEYEAAPTDRFNRNVAGFDPDAELAVTAAARAAYAANPAAGLPASQFNPRGGVLFASGAEPGFYRPDRNNWQPRFGAAYQLDARTVLRGGWALYAVPALFDDIVFQPGFSQATPVVASNNNGLTYRASLTSPFPTGVLTPVGDAAGVNTFVGQGLTRFTTDRDFRNGQVMRWSANVQRDLGRSWVVEAGYIGSKGYDLTTQIDLNAIPEQYLSTSAVRDTAQIAYLAQPVANPFAGLLPGTALNATNVARSQLLRPFPQFTAVLGRRYDGSSRYDSGQFRLEKRFSQGYTVLTTYTVSRSTERLTLLNPTDTSYEERLTAVDAPHRLALNGIWELPFGRDRRFGSGAPGAVNALIGGWSVSAIWQWQSGRPLDIGNLYYNGDINALEADYSAGASAQVFDSSGFYFSDIPEAQRRSDPRIQLTNNYRTLPTRTSNLRMAPTNYWDVSFVKRFPITERVRAQLHLELYNATNAVIYDVPNLTPSSGDFGLVTNQINTPQNLQIGFRLIF